MEKKKIILGILLVTIFIFFPNQVEAKVTKCTYQIDYCVTRIVGGSGAASGATTKTENKYVLSVTDNNGTPQASIVCKDKNCMSLSSSQVFSVVSKNDFYNDKGEYRCPTLYKCNKCVSSLGNKQGKYYSNQSGALSTTSSNRCSGMTTARGSATGSGEEVVVTGSGIRTTTIGKGCENTTILKIIYFILNILKIATYLVPVGLIFFGMYDFFKGMITSDNTILKNTFSNFIRRIIGAIVIFLVPSIINFGFGMVENDIHSGYLMCIKNANKETIQQLKEQESQIIKQKNEEIKKKQEEAKEKREETIRKEQEGQMQAGAGLGSKLNSIITGASKKVAFLNSLKKMSEQIEKDAKKGKKWAYADKNKHTFDIANKTKKTTNCAAIAYWGLIDIGILENGDVFYKGSKKIRYSSNKTKQKLQKNLEYIDGGNKTADSLIKSGKLQAGDIIAWSFSHTSVYAGDNKWYDAGRRKGINGKYYGSVYRFKTIGPFKVGNTKNWRIKTILRIKG